MPVLARGAALRFMLTRLVDWLNVPAGALVKPKDPLEYLTKLRFHQDGDVRQRLRMAMSETMTIWTDGACSGNPGPGGWGAILRAGAHEKELFGGEPGHHQQPHGTDRRHHGARERLKRPCEVDLTPIRNMCAAASPDGSPAGSATAGAPPTRSRSRTSSFGSSSMPPTLTHKVRWHWVKGHAGHAENERADALARQGMAPFLKR